MNIRTFLLTVKSKLKGDPPATLEQINDILQKINELEIKYQRLREEMSANLPTGNLTVVSQNPVKECDKSFSALVRGFEYFDLEADPKECAKELNRRIKASLNQD